MAEKQAKRRPLIGQLLWARMPRPVGRRVDANHGYAFPAQNDDLCLIPQKSRAFEIANLRGPGERITRYRDVVIAEHDERTVQARQEGLEAPRASRMGDEVSRDADEVGSPFSNPTRGPLARTVAAREGRAEVEVGQVSDPDAVESLWESVERNFEHTRPEPTGLEPAVGEERDGRADNDQEDEHPGTLETRTNPSLLSGSPVEAGRCIW